LSANITLTTTSNGNVSFGSTINATAVSSLLNTFSVNGYEAEPRSVTFNNDGTKMFVIGYAGDDVNEYTLSTGFDLSSTVTHVDTYNASGDVSFPTGLTFNSDGSKMFILDNAGNDVNEYTLSTGFDLSSTITLVKTLSISSQENTPLGITFNNDGTKMFVAGDGGDIHEYTVSNGFDLTSTVTFIDTFSTVNEETFPTSVKFNTDGTTMFVTGVTSDSLIEYTLSSGFDVSTASFTDKYNITSDDNYPTSLDFNDDGSKIFVAGDQNNNIREYSLTNNYSISAQTLSITTNGTGDVTFTDDVGGSAGLNGLTISTNDFNAVDLKVGGTISITNTGTSSEITGVIADDGDAAVFTKAGTGTLTLSNVNNSYTGATTVNNGTLKVTNNNALGTNAAGTTVASGATLDFVNVTYSTTEAITVNGGTIATSTGTSTVAGDITLGAHSIFDIDETQLTVSGNVTDGDGIYNITKTGDGILVLSNTTNSYDGTTTISAGTLTVTGRLDSGTYSANIINNSALIYNSASAQEFSGVDKWNRYFRKSKWCSTLTLSGTNTYSGATTISAGIIAISDADALGNDSGTRGTTTVDSGAALYISGGITVAEPINISGTGVSSGGAIRFTANNNTYSGAITLGATSTIVSNSGQQTISGTINGTNDNTEALTITANDDLTISGAIGGIANKQLSTLDITTTGTSRGINFK
jgi:autotransporter-associated beta strand protein